MVQEVAVLIIIACALVYSAKGIYQIIKPNVGAKQQCAGCSSGVCNCHISKDK